MHFTITLKCTKLLNNLFALLLLFLLHDFCQGLSFVSGCSKGTLKPSNRRNLLKKLSTQAILLSQIVKPILTEAAETVGKDADCNDTSCLGVWDGMLADCPHGKMNMMSGAGCASSQDDTPGVFAEPWDYSEDPNNLFDWESQMKMLIPAIQLVAGKRGDKVTVLLQTGRYLRVLFVDGKSGEESIGEFYYTPDDTTVQFRVGSIQSLGTSIMSPSTKNLERCEMIRKQMRYLKIPVLRNRKRSLIFVESEFDTFGPGSASLGPPSEMTSEELNGIDDKELYPKLDLLQQFPLGK